MTDFHDCKRAFDPTKPAYVDQVHVGEHDQEDICQEDRRNCGHKNVHDDSPG
ncbi:MAG: hypothetical protein WCF90_11030 [Methanomicrobiales archaeon]